VCLCVCVLTKMHNLDVDSQAMHIGLYQKEWTCGGKKEKSVENTDLWGQRKQIPVKTCG